MLRKALFISIATFFSTAIAGCHLYIEDRDNGYDETYEYCDQSGCYSCDDSGCITQNGEGMTCARNTDCEAGCYCNPDGICEEAGFCIAEQANSCPTGFECDDRSSCVPEGSDDACTNDKQCPKGSFCDEASGACVGTYHCDDNRNSCGLGYECDDRGTCIPAACSDDQMCKEGSYCDESRDECIETTTCDANSNCPKDLACDTGRNTCVPEEELVLSCQAIVTCKRLAPICPLGSTPIIEAGCYTEQCMKKSECPDGAPFECRDLNSKESECVTNASCGTVYKGINCTSTSGDQCLSGSQNCTCDSFVFDYCDEV